MRKHFKVTNSMIVFVLIVAIFLATIKLYSKFMLAANSYLLFEYDMYRSLISIAFIMIGILMEYKSLLKGLKEGFRIHWFRFLSSLLLISVLFIPYKTSIMLLGLGTASTILQSGLFRSAISIMGGICLVRSICKEDENQYKVST